MQRQQVQVSTHEAVDFRKEKGVEQTSTKYVWRKSNCLVMKPLSCWRFGDHLALHIVRDGLCLGTIVFVPHHHTMRAKTGLRVVHEKQTSTS